MRRLIALLSKMDLMYLYTVIESYCQTITDNICKGDVVILGKILNFTDSKQATIYRIMCILYIRSHYVDSLLNMHGILKKLLKPRETRNSDISFWVIIDC